MKFDFVRWRYRRMAWLHDRGLWCNMHPQIAILIDKLYDKSWPFRREVSDFIDSCRTTARIRAIEEVHGYERGKWDMKYWKYEDTAADVYAWARSHGWTREHGWKR